MQTNHFDTDAAQDFIEDIEHYMAYTIKDNFSEFLSPNPEVKITNDKIVGICAFLEHNTQGPGEHHRLDLRRFGRSSEYDLYLQAVLCLEKLMKDEAWLNKWGMDRHNKERNLNRLYKNLHKKWEKM